jgi:hypothetical protein
MKVFSLHSPISLISLKSDCVFFQFAGRGIFALKDFFQGDFLVEYRGKLVNVEPLGNDSYCYEFIHRNQQFWCVHTLLQLYVLFVFLM